ncbi:MAG: hypothetical protein IH940_10430, partial [Acidobacteria bacterium]|nr:hypothetical protein [Acidobacteriota bacterium]
MRDSTKNGPAVVVVSHFHWDREWYRTMQAFRARLVDAMDQVLDLADADDDYRFVLDGQIIALEDYVEVRPENRDRLRAHIGAGRLGIGPWYVQPDSLLPSGESMVRNLMMGRRIGEQYGSLSTVAYVPDSFGHPAQFPQLFCGFGLDGFTYWRGNGGEIDRLGPRWLWVGPDGSSVRALHLSEGYFAAARPPNNVDEATTTLRTLVNKLDNAGERPVLLMNGFDHTRPDPHMAAVAKALAEDLNRPVTRALFDDVIGMLDGDEEAWPEYSGELIGGRVANLLPGVWSARMPLKIANRRCEVALSHWAEPWAAFGAALGLADERPALNLAWQALIENQAHDSICGCSIDPVHDYMTARFDDALGLAEETTIRILERLAGRGDDRDVPREHWSVTVFNTSAHACTGIVTVPLDAHPALPLRVGVPDLHPLVLAGLAEQGFAVEGQPCVTTVSDDPRRVRWLESQRVFDVTFVATDIPAFGCRTYQLDTIDPVADEVDDGRRISAGTTAIEIDDDGTATIEVDGVRIAGLFGLEDQGDRGDSYDFDPVGEPLRLRPESLSVTRRQHPGGIAELDVERCFVLPAGLNEDRSTRSDQTVNVSLRMVLRVAPGIDAVSASVTLDNRACDHRLRLLFPTGDPVEEFLASSMFLVSSRSTDLSEWQRAGVDDIDGGGVDVVQPHRQAAG